MTNLKDKYGEWGLVTGAARRYGLGEAFAKQLAADGVNLVLVDILGDELNERAQELSVEYGIDVRPVILNLERDDIISELAKATDELEIGILVCNHYYLDAGKFHSVSVDEHIKMIDINVRAYMLMVHYFGNEMIKNGRGGIVMVSSLVATMPIPYNVHYSSFKAYILNMAEALNHELKQQGVDIIGLIAPFMNSADARDTTFPQFILDDTNKVAKVTLKNLGKRARIQPGVTSKLIHVVFTRLMRRSKGLARFGELIWENIKDVVEVE